MSFRRFSGRRFQARSVRQAARNRNGLAFVLERLESRQLLTGRDSNPQVSYAVDAEWSGAQQAAISVMNRQAENINDWTFEFDYPRSIDTIWNARIISRVNDHYIIGPDGWNTSIAAGASASFGFTNSPGGSAVKPTAYALNWQTTTAPQVSPLSVAFTIPNDWGSGFTGNLTIKNNGSTTINGWTLEFDFDRSIDSVWNASLVSRSGNHYVLKNADYNKTIKPGESVTVGFNGSPGNVASKPLNYIINGIQLGISTPTLSVANTMLAEGTAQSPGAAAFTVSLSQSSTKSITVNYATLDASALAGNDYLAKSGTLTFAPGETQKALSVPLVGDSIVETSEVFILRLTSPKNAGISDGQAIATIQDDDAPQITINDVSVTEGDSGTTSALFTVSLSSASTSAISVGFSTAGDTAISGTDFTATSGTLTIPAGSTKATINIAVKGDAIDELNERFFVNLSNPANAVIADGQGIGTVVDDDATPGAFNYGEALQKSLFFYEAQRSGDLPANYTVDWRADSAMNDGKDVGLDLTGGYWDAGDHVKFGLPMAGSMTLLAWGAIQYRDAYAQTGQLNRILDAIRWGADYLVKAHPSPNVFYGQVGRGDLDHASWVAPEVMQMARPAFKIDPQNPGSDLAGEAAAALAATALAFQTIDPAYAALLIQHAEQLFNFADTYRGKYSDSIKDAANYYNSFSGYNDELVWAGAWLYKATGKATYLAKAEAIYAQNYANQTWTWTHSWDDKRYGAGILLAQLTGKDQYRKDVERWLDYWTVGINGGSTRVAYTPGGLAFLNGWGSLRYAATTSFMALMYSDTVRDIGTRYHDFAVSQINYILGANPRKSSYEVGFGNNYPQEPHHRGASGSYDGNVNAPGPNRHILYGALVGGPESADDFDYHDERSNYISNEVALDYNAGFTGALARLALEYGGKTLDKFPIPETRDNEFFVQASINQQGSTFTEVRALLNNRSAWPARLSAELGFRYFVNLSEVTGAGYAINQVDVTSNYSQGAQVSGLIPWDAVQGIYYVDIRFSGVTIGPGAGMYAKEAQVRIGLKSGLPASAWNPANDWSYQGLQNDRDKLIVSSYIPVYEFGTQKLSGQTPGTSNPGTPTLSVENVVVTEGNSGQTQATFMVRLSQPSTKTVTVAYQTADGTAKVGSDYTAKSGKLTFAPGVVTQAINVPVLGDTTIEGDESFLLKLSNATNAAIGVAQASATITDDDAPKADVEVLYEISDDWGTGFVANITIKNKTAAEISDWILEFDLSANISGVWNADIVSHVGTRYVIKPKDWTKRIAANGSVSFGFQAAPGNAPNTLTNIYFNGKKL